MFRRKLLYTTSGLHYWRAPAGVRRIWLRGCGGGGGGGGGMSGWGTFAPARRACGGNAGGSARAFDLFWDVTPGTLYTLSIGIGGTPGTSAAQNGINLGGAGGAGADTRFGTGSGPFTWLITWPGASGGTGGNYGSPGSPGTSQAKKLSAFISGSAYFLPNAGPGTGGWGGYWGNNATELWYASVTGNGNGPWGYMSPNNTQGTNGDSWNDLGAGSHYAGHGGGGGPASAIPGSTGGNGGLGGSGNSAGSATAGAAGTAGTFGGGGGGGGGGGNGTGAVTNGAGGVGGSGGTSVLELRY